MKEIFDQLIYPKPLLILGLISIILIDLLTGIRKSNKLGIATLSRGLRNTVDKATTYFSLVVAVLVLINVTKFGDKGQDFLSFFYYSINGLLVAFCYIEFKSILENLIEINTSYEIIKFNKPKPIPNDFARIILIPFHNLLILKLQSKKREINEA